MGSVFLCNSGAEANECAIKLARKYSHDKYGDGRSTIVTLCNSFHGRTVTTLAATGQDSFHQHFMPFTEGFVYAEPGSISAFMEKLDDTVCAVLVECIQGEGGVVPLDVDYLRAVEQTCRDRDILFMVDEVQTGVGRTGKFMAYEHAEVHPDVVSMAKGLGGGLPIGACLCTNALSGVLSAGMHGSTFGGNPVVCAGGRYILSKITEPAFLQSVNEKGAYLRKRLESMPHVQEVRGKGMMLGVVLDSGRARTIAEKCLQKGLLILTAKTLLRLLPPLNITQEEMDKGLSILENILEGMVDE
jgi:acetylornithine/N-succinyldiaminopimelate aminotransferase